MWLKWGVRLAVPVQAFAPSGVHTCRPDAHRVRAEGLRRRRSTGHGAVHFPAGHVVQVSRVQVVGGVLWRLQVQRFPVRFHRWRRLRRRTIFEEQKKKKKCDEIMTTANRMWHRIYIIYIYLLLLLLLYASVFLFLVSSDSYRLPIYYNIVFIVTLSTWHAIIMFSVTILYFIVIQNVKN